MFVTRVSSERSTVSDRGAARLQVLEEPQGASAWAIQIWRVRTVPRAGVGAGRGRARRLPAACSSSDASLRANQTIGRTEARRLCRGLADASRPLRETVGSSRDVRARERWSGTRDPREFVHSLIWRFRAPLDRLRIV